MLVATQEHSSETAVDKTEEGGDDVLTTGATTEAAVQQLLTIEGVRVSVVTLATAQG